MYNGELISILKIGILLQKNSYNILLNKIIYSYKSLLGRFFSKRENGKNYFTK